MKTPPMTAVKTLNALLAVAALSMFWRELEKRRSQGGAEGVRPLYVIHQTGVLDEGPVIGSYAAARLPSRVHAFEKEMADALASADVVIARAGASTCFELAACGKPALLVPLPSAVRDHQHFNAQAFVQAGAADEGIQDSLTPRALANYILHKIDHPEELAKKASAMRAMSVPDAAEKVANLLERVADPKNLAKP